MKKSICLLITGFLLYPHQTFAQSVHLNHNQMLEDIDSLQSKIYRYCSFLPLLEQRTNISISTIFEQLRQKVTSNTSTAGFADIVWQHLNILQDGHSGIVNSSRVKWVTSSNYYLAPVGNVSLSDTLHANNYVSLTADSVFSAARSGIRAKYLNGKYYNMRPFTFNQTPVKLGEEITAINGVNIHHFIQEYCTQIYALEWDSECKQWFSDYFMLSLPKMGLKKFSLTIGGREVVIDSDSLVHNLERERYQPFPYSPRLMLIDSSILYVCMPTMMNAQWYIQEIRRIYRTGIEKVIFDLRGNSGGDDSVWWMILSALVKQPLNYRYYVGMNDHETLRMAVSAFGDFEKRDNILTVSRERTIKPDNATLGFDGHIYIFQDRYTYSAASAFVSAAMQNKERFTVIGEPSRLFSGYSFPAILFSLPNSKLVYSLAFSTDLTGGKENPFMDKVDILIKDNIDEYIEKLFDYDSFSEEYLTKKDRLIKYVRDLQSNHQKNFFCNK